MTPGHNKFYYLSQFERATAFAFFFKDIKNKWSETRDKILGKWENICLNLNPEQLNFLETPGGKREKSNFQLS